MFCVTRTRDEVTSATVNDDVFFSVEMFCSIELMKSENVPVINPPSSRARVCRTSHTSLTLRDIREDRPAGAEGRARMRSVAVVVEEADLLVETPVETLVEAATGVTAQALAFGRFCDVVEVVDLRLLLTSRVLEVLATRLRDRWALWSCYRERAVRRNLA